MTLINSIKLFGFVDGLNTWWFLQKMHIENKFCELTKKKWCRQNGYYCKNKDCKFEHFDKPPRLCNAMLEFDGTNRFVMCELDEKNHENYHKAIGFVWEGDICFNSENSTTNAHSSYLYRHQALFKEHLKKSINRKV